VGRSRPYLALEVGGTRIPVLIDSGSTGRLTLRESDPLRWEVEPVQVAASVRYNEIRIDRAGQSSKRYAGASAAPIIESDSRCPLWSVHAAFNRPREIMPQLVELEDGERWFTLSRTVSGHGAGLNGGEAIFSIAIGLKAEFASSLVYARGLDMAGGDAQPIGLGCSSCTRKTCPQRSAPPRGRTLLFNERERGLSPFDFAAG